MPCPVCGANLISFKPGQEESTARFACGNSATTIAEGRHAAPPLPKPQWIQRRWPKRGLILVAILLVGMIALLTGTVQDHSLNAAAASPYRITVENAADQSILYAIAINNVPECSGMLKSAWLYDPNASCTTGREYIGKSYLFSIVVEWENGVTRSYEFTLTSQSVYLLVDDITVTVG